MNEEQDVMQVGVPYIATTPGDNGDIEVGFHLLFTPQQSLFCQERGGFIDDMAVIQEVLTGVKVIPDLVGIKVLRLAYLENIRALSPFPDPTDEEWEAQQSLEDVILDLSVNTDNPQ